jgi:site-specific DNA-methyltransferase (adenine-specific)
MSLFVPGNEGLDLKAAVKTVKKGKADRRAANQQTYQQNGHAPFVPPTDPNIHIYNVDARGLAAHTSDVHLVITSPPYDVGIEYDAYRDNNPDYLTMLSEVWRACYGVMADGARIAVVVPFGVGRNPYSAFDCQVIQTLGGAGFALRGRIIWDKGTTGNRTSWGSYRMASNPSLRDTCECIIIAQKGSADLAIPDGIKETDAAGSYMPWLKDGDYFMELAQDHWLVPPESATRVGHPAPFPKELVRRLIHFYGFPGCHVVDPFGGSGTVGVVAKELGCQATLFEISEQYCQIATERIHG